MLCNVTLIRSFISATTHMGNTTSNILLESNIRHMNCDVKRFNLSLFPIILYACCAIENK